jgi:VWFA-related protein
MKSKLCIAALVCLAVAATTLGQVQQPSPTPRPAAQEDKDDIVRITTNLVQVDVVVTKNGKVVTDLTANDFEIFEDGKRQTITNFLYVSNVANASAVSGATAAPPVTSSKNRNPSGPPPPPVEPNEARRMMALVIDDLGLSAESMNQVRKQLRKFVDEQMQPNDLVAIIRTGADIGALQQFTNDKRLLHSAINQAQWNVCSRVGPTVFQLVSPTTVPLTTNAGSSCGFESVRSSLTSLRFILQAMGELPGRKSMVLFSDSIPRQEQEITVRDEDDPGSQVDERNYYVLLQRLAEIAIRNSVVIYGVDTQGLQYAGPTAGDAVSNSSLRGGVDSQMINQQVNAIRRQRTLELIRRREGADVLSKDSGGFLIKNSNDFKLDQIMNDQQGYYLLGYRPNTETFDRHFHHISAKVKGSGLSLRTRKGFYGFTEDEANRLRQEVNKTDAALISPFRSHDIAIDLATIFAKDPAQGSVLRSFLYIDAKSLTFQDDGEGWHKVAVEMRGIIFGSNGRPLDEIVVTPTVRLQQGTYDQALRDGLLLRFDMPVKRPGAYQLRVAARDLVSSRVGSAGQFVTVPDPNRDFSMSGIVLSGATEQKILTISAPDPSAAATTAKVEARLSPNPVNRKFKAGNNLIFGFVIYNANTSEGPPQLTVDAKMFREGKLVDSADGLRVGLAGQKELTRITTSGVLHLKPDLEPGRYYLQLVTIDSGKKKNQAVQWIDFEIVKP